jgi:hypothetical protein
MKIALVNSKIDNPNFYIINSIYQSFVHKLGKNNVYLLDYFNLLESIDKLSIDTLLVLDGGMSDNLIIKLSCEKVTHSYVWRFDDPYDLQSLLNTNEWFSHVFTTDIKTSKEFLNTSHLELSGCNTDFSALNPLQEREFDLLFVGTLWPNRLEFINQIANLSNFKINIISNHIEFEKSEVFKFDSKINFFPRVSFLDYSYLLANTKIVLTLGRNFSVGEHNSSESLGVPPRFFDALSWGCIQIVDEYIYNTLPTNFGSTYCCKTPQQLPKIVYDLTTNSRRLQKNVDEDLDKYVRTYSWESRVNYILEVRNQ